MFSAAVAALGPNGDASCSDGGGESVFLDGNLKSLELSSSQNVVDLSMTWTHLSDPWTHRRARPALRRLRASDKQALPCVTSCLPQRSSSSCCGGCTCATPSAPCRLLSTNRVTWPWPSTTSCWSRPSSTSSGKRTSRNAGEETRGCYYIDKQQDVKLVEG